MGQRQKLEAKPTEPIVDSYDERQGLMKRTQKRLVWFAHSADEACKPGADEFGAAWGLLLCYCMIDQEKPGLRARVFSTMLHLQPTGCARKAKNFETK